MDFREIRYGFRGRSHRLGLPLIFLSVGLLALPLASQAGPQGLLAVALCAVLYLGILLHIHLGLGLLVVCFGLSPEFQLAGVTNLRLEDLFIPVVVLAWATRISVGRERLDPTNLKAPLIILVSLSLISSLMNYAWFGLGLFNSILFFGKTVEYYLIFLVVMNVVKTREEVLAYTFLLLAVSLGAGILGIHQYLTVPGAKVTGPAGETANIFGGYLAFHMLIAVGLAISIPKLWTRIVLGAYLLAIMVPMLSTFSRTTFAAFFGGLISLAFLRKGRALVGVAILLVMLPAVFPEQATERLASIVSILSDNPPPSWTARVNAWQKFGGLVMESPLIGRGVGSAPLGHIDNEYLKQANELGLIGLLVFFWLLIAIFRTALRSIKRASDPLILGYCTGFAAGFVAILVHNLGATSLTTIRIAEPFFFATGLLYAITNHLLPEEGEGFEPVLEEGDRGTGADSDGGATHPGAEGGLQEVIDGT